MQFSSQSNHGGSGGHFKNTYELLNLRALKFSRINEICIFQCIGKIFFVWNFKGTLWNSTKNISPIYWKVWFLYNIEISRALRIKSSYVFLKCRPGHLIWSDMHGHVQVVDLAVFSAIERRWILRSMLAKGGWNHVMNFLKVGMKITN